MCTAGYGVSTFERLAKAGLKKWLLTEQYRMHPQISRFPGRRFYDGALKDAPRMAELNAAPWHAKRCFGPYVFYDVHDGVATEVASSWSNELEAQLAVQIVRRLLEGYEGARAAGGGGTTRAPLPGVSP